MKGRGRAGVVPGGGGGGTQSGKGYPLWSHHWLRTVAAATRDGLKRGAVLLFCCRIGELSEPVQQIFHVK